MASRYPRDRSPPRPLDRRPSTTYTPGASSYRGTGEPQTYSQDRPPPRGPKADFRGGGYQFSSAPRGRGGFAPRIGDTWDRDRERDRDARAQPPAYRRDEDRDWTRRERDFPSSDRGVGFPRERGYVGRERSASPDRPRRNSKENIATTFGRPSEAGSTYYGPAARGGAVRGRGRGDWDRSRGRSSFVSERDREFLPRSRSREGWRDRYDDRGRASGPDAERNDRFDRRDYDRPDERDVRGREHDVWQRDRSPGRNSNGRPVSPGALSTISQHGDRYKTDYDTGRKPSLAGPLSARSDGRREVDVDYFASRIETPRRDGPLSQPFSTTNVPQSSALGLDYGDDPSVPATTPSVQEKIAPPPPKPQAVKVDPPSAPAAAPTAPAALQPPSGPKADRVGPPHNAPSTPRAVAQQFEQWPKSEPASRPIRPGPALHTAPSMSEPNWKQSDSPADNRTPTVAGAAADRPLPANIPSGPRATTSNFRSRLLSNEQAAPNAPPTAPRQPKASVLENRVIPNAPTGPRSSTFPAPNVLHSSPPTGPQAGSNRQWVAPDYRPTKPSIMNQMNKPYQPDPRERSSLSGPSRPGGVIYQSQQAKPKITQPLTSESALLTQSAKLIGSLAETPSGAQTPMDDDMVDSPADVEMSLPASDEEDVEDDDGLDEDYFAASEETHRREMKLLESKKPLPPLYDPTTAALLIKIQLLGMIANDIVPEAYEAVKANADSAMDLDSAPNNAPLSPEHTPEGSSRPALEHPRPRGRPLSQPLINLIPTPPIDELPYLNDAMEECHVFEETEDEVVKGATTMLLCESFEQESWEDTENLDDLRAFYKSRYPLWRREVEQAEQRLREVHQPSPAPASPAPSATPSLPPGPERPGGERTRGARNTTDLDMQQAILMSQQSAKEEEERREREAASNALPNIETEAVVPCMLKPTEVDLHYFEDTNNMVAYEFALDVYRFIPPEDDFTDEEQAAFIAAYCQNPKKWGKIAASIPGRSYQDCIAHYYLTKDKANYKEHWRRSQPKRGRRRAANIKPRANNLMSDLALNEEGESTPVAVTDSGRPRRAAAPTFGDAPESDAASNAPQAKRLKDSGKDMDPSQPKPRGRKGTGAGKGRKAKDKVMVDPAGQLLLPAGNMEATSQKLERLVNGKEKSGRSSLKTEAIPKLELYGGAPALTASMSLDPNKMNHGELPPSNVDSVPVQVTSYWSVPEQQKFPLLIQYFGRDFSAIASFLKTKSPIMIKNHYTKEVNNGKIDLEHYAILADERKARGEPLGPPPTPVQPPKRRYEATPSTVIHRPVANVTDHHMTEAEPIIPAVKNVVEEFPPNSVQRVSGEVVAKPRPSRESLHHSPNNAHIPPKMEESTRNDRPLMLQKPLQSGPPRGLFLDEPVTYPQQAHQKLQGSIQEVSPHQRPIQVAESRPVESRTQQPSSHIDLRRTDYGRGVLSHNQEQTSQPPQVASIPQYQQMSDRNIQHSRLATHSRHPSLVTSHVGQSNHEQAAAELVSLRHVDPLRGITYNVSAAHSPAPVPVQPNIPPSMDPHIAARPNTQAPESAKPAAKRSNVFNILNNDEDDAPPAKKIPLESIKRSNVNTPPPQAPSAHPSMGPSRHHEDSVRPSQTPYGHVSRNDSIRPEYRPNFQMNPASSHQSEAVWLDKFDPRQSQTSDQRPAQQPTAPGPYSVVPPSSQSNPTTSVAGRFDPTRNIEPGVQHRQRLGMDHAPSPPPQQPQSINPHRSLSGSSQHGRGLSSSYQQIATTGPPSYPHSSSSTPVSALQHRSQHSMDQPRPASIQQYMKEQREQMHAQRREIETMQQQPTTQSQLAQQPSSQQPPRLSDRYGSAQEPRSAHHVPPSSQTPQPQPLGMPYSTAPPQPSRTYTPPHPSYGVSGGITGHSHGHHGHQQQYQPHQSQYPQSQHHQAYQNHPGYGPPPPQSLQHQRGSVHSLGAAPQGQQNPYRNYGTEERR